MTAPLPSANEKAYGAELLTDMTCWSACFREIAPRLHQDHRLFGDTRCLDLVQVQATADEELVNRPVDATTAAQRGQHIIQ